MNKTTSLYRISGGGGGTGSGGGGGGVAAASDSEKPPIVRCSIVNVVICMISITSLALSVLANVNRQGHAVTATSSSSSLAERLDILDKRIASVEEQMATRPVSVKFTNIPDWDVGGGGGGVDVRPTVHSEVLQKMSLQVAKLERLRRDVSQLKLTRPERQASIQQSPAECMCPAGEFLNKF